MRKLLVILALCALVSSAFAGGHITRRMSDGSVLTFKRHLEKTPLGSVPDKLWDANKTYRVPVVLFSFADCDFSGVDPKQFYDRMFNEQGYNLGKGPGCIADYFRDQSNGLFNVQFDIIGPVKLSTKQKSNNDYHGTSQVVEALKAADKLADFSAYDWDGKGMVQTVILIYAGYGGNEDTTDKGNITDGCIWPNTSYLFVTADGVSLRYYSASNELWTNNQSVGIGTIIHEYLHTFGLPDIYPTSGSEYSIVDEWDVMDGGCYSGDGWCPVNLSSHERELMNWQTPIDLTTSTDITNMPSYDQSGLAYRIVNDAHIQEVYHLENRQQVGWDLMIPGHGLVISHIDYDYNFWVGNTINNDPDHHRYELFNADGLAFSYYQGLYGIDNVFNEDGRSIRLQNTAYPYTNSLGVAHDALTDTTTPAAILYHARKDGKKFMGKPITQIRENNGVISFHFSDTPDAIATLHKEAVPVAVYDLQGNVLSPCLPVSLSPSSSPRIYIVRYSDGSTKKITQ